MTRSAVLWRTFIVPSLFACLISGAANGQTVTQPCLHVDVFASGFSVPTGFSFIGSDELFVIEKNTGRVKLFQAGSGSTTVLDLNVSNDNERGLLGIATHPSFANNNQVYVYFSANDVGSDSNDPNHWTENRLSRFTWNGSALTSEQILLRFERDPAQANGANHDGGPLVFGPDGRLYGVTGDLNRDRAEQNEQTQAANSSDVGGIYRVNAPGTDPQDGSDPNDNPFITHANSEFHRLFAYGVRNSFGLAFDPMTNTLWDTENGPSTYDEINLVAPGFNSGWSQIMGPDSRDPQGVGDLVDLGSGSTYSDPEFSFLFPIGITDLVFLAGFLDPSYHDAVVFGGANAVNAGRLHILRLNTNRDGFDVSGLPVGLSDFVTDNSAELDSLTFGTGFGITTDIQIGPGGALYILSLTNGELYQVVPEPGTALVVGLGLMLITVNGRRERARALSIQS